MLFVTRKSRQMNFVKKKKFVKITQPQVYGTTKTEKPKHYGLLRSKHSLEECTFKLTLELMPLPLPLFLDTDLRSGPLQTYAVALMPEGCNPVN